MGPWSLFVSFLLAKKLFDSRTGFLAVLLAVAVPGNCLLNFVLTIDAPLVLAWSLSLFFLWKYTKGEQPVVSLLFLFLSIGMGHLSKQMMLVFPVLALIFLATGKETRPLLKRPGPWLAIVGSFIFLAPHMIWNARNGWITRKHESSHFGGQLDLGERVKEFFEFVGTQIGALSPVIGVLVFLLTVVAMFRKKNIAPRFRFLIVFCGVPLVLFLILSMTQKVQPNWPAVCYIAGVIMVAAWFSQAIDWYQVSDRARGILLKVGITIGLLLCGFFYFGPIVFSITGNEGHKLDPNRRLIGSDRFTKAVQEVRKTVPGWENHFVAATGHRHPVSWLAFGLPDRPRVYHVLRNELDSQYQIWPGVWDDGYQGQNGIFVIPGITPTLDPRLGDAFEKVEKLDEIEVKFGRGISHFTIFRAIGMKSPLPRPKDKIESREMR